MDDDFDLEGLSLADARAYVVRFVQTLHLTRDQRADAEKSLEEWKRRIRLAIDKGETDLAKASMERAEEVHARVVRLKHEEGELDFKVTELKRRLARLQTEPQLSVDASGLLDRLESVVGTDHETDRAAAEAEAEIALQALRRRMESEEGNNE